jgi:methanogenic corrinoid protein MtbC1
MSSALQLIELIDQLEEAGLRPKVTVLPSAVGYTRKSALGVKMRASRRRAGKAQMQDCNKFYHSSGHN